MEKEISSRERDIDAKYKDVDFEARARELGMRTLREDGMLKVSSGLTSLSEVLRVTMGDAD